MSIHDSPQLNLTKLKPELLKFDMQNRKLKTLYTNLLHHSSSTFFKLKSSLILEYDRKTRNVKSSIVIFVAYFAYS